MKGFIYPILIIAAIITLYFWRSPQPPKVEVIDPLEKASQNESRINENIIEFAGRNNTDLLTILGDKATVQTDDEGRIFALNGKENNEQSRWYIYINGKLNENLPQEIMTADEDQIEIKYEEIPTEPKVTEKSTEKATIEETAEEETNANPPEGEPASEN